MGTYPSEVIVRNGFTAEVGPTLADGPEVFTSWKEISAYLGKSVRTVQRWEGEFGLPVQRANGSSKGTVRASRKEIDAWLRNRWSLRPADEAGSTVSENILNSHRLLEERRRLLMECQRSLMNLTKECELWRSQLTESNRFRHKS